MKKLIPVFSLILCLALLLPAFPASAATLSAGGYRTVTMQGAKLVSVHADQTVGGSNCTSMQGMAVGEKYIYTAKRDSKDAYVSIARTDADTGEVVYMKYYADDAATTTAALDVCGHANDMLLAEAGGNEYLFVATSAKGVAFTRLRVSGDSLYFAGCFDFVNTKSSQISASSVRLIKQQDGYFFFLIKNAETFYYCKIAEDDAGGTKAAPAKIKCHKLFTIDKRNAVFANADGTFGTVDNVETYVNQGFGYNPEEQVIYVPMFKPAGSITTNIIVTYYVGDVLKDENLTFSGNKTTLIHPTKTNFYLYSKDFNASCTTLEIESAGFRTGQGENGDLRLYVNANAAPVASYEGVYVLDYTSGSGDFTPMVGDDAVVYTVKYDGNGGTDSATNSSSGNYKMNDTVHIRGVETKLRPNKFTKSGYQFSGWYLTRESDGKWLYLDGDGVARWYLKGEQPVSSHLALYGDKQAVSDLTDTDGDTVTCVAQWLPNMTIAHYYYIRYEANGGEGAMDDTRVSYGTETEISKNAFTREGYVFTGWTVYRSSDGSRLYKTADLGDKWVPAGDGAEGLFLGAIPDGGTVYNLSETKRDLLTFYASWARVEDGVYPETVEEGTDFTLGGRIRSGAGIYAVTAAVKDEGGRTVASYTANPYANEFDLAGANAGIDFPSLNYGSYTYTVSIQTAGDAPSDAYTLLEAPFTVSESTNPHIALTKEAWGDSRYSLTEQYFSGFAAGTTAKQLKALFRFDPEVKDQNGKVLADTETVSTGCTVNVAGDSRTLLLRGDANGDGKVNNIDASFALRCDAGLEKPDGLRKTALDLNLDGEADNLDAVLILAEDAR